jgi:hypothetical protein
LKAWITLRTWESSVRTSAAICGADIPVAEASTIIARSRFDWYLARREIERSRMPLLGRQLTDEHLRRSHRHLPVRGHGCLFAAGGEFPVERLREVH